MASMTLSMSVCVCVYIYVKSVLEIAFLAMNQFSSVQLLSRV